MNDGGKGSKPRAFSVSHEEWSNRWDAIFGRDLSEQEDKPTRNNEETQEAQQQEKN